MSLFIRDDIPVRQLDRRYKKLMRFIASRAAWATYGYGHAWRPNYPAWECKAAVEKVTLKGA